MARLHRVRARLYEPVRAPRRRFGKIIEIFADPTVIKIIVSYSMVSSSVTTSYKVQVR